MIDADVFHSQEPSVGTALAQIGAPDKKHVVTFQDPRDVDDWKREWAAHPPTTLEMWRFWLRYQWEMGGAARRANALFCQAKYIVDKSKKIYRLKQNPGFLPNPVTMTPIARPKSSTPKVCFLGRWDERKRPELFLDLAARFPHVTFVIAGACLNNSKRDEELRQRGRNMRNVEMPGWLDDVARSALLDESWMLVNTSTRECLPVTYLEAGSHKCAILSHGNADDFASEFGYWAETGDLPDYVRGLTSLLENDRWRALGERAYEYVKNTHEYGKVIDQHVETYRRIVAS
jgi:glycosyltransferase involved in cell wall biosynthesis